MLKTAILGNNNSFQLLVEQLQNQGSYEGESQHVVLWENLIFLLYCGTQIENTFALNQISTDVYLYA